MLDKSETAMQRAGPASGIAALVRDLGADPGGLADGLAVDLDTLGPDAMIRFDDGITLLERAARLTACPHFGLLLGSRYDNRVLGIVGALAGNGATLRDALTDFVTWQHRNSRGAAVYLHRIGDDYALGYGIYGRTTRAATQIYDLSIAIACNTVRRLTGGRAEPAEIHLSHRPPGERRPYHDVLKAPIRFDQSQSCLVLTAAALDAPVIGAMPTERERLKSVLGSTIEARIPDAAGRLRHALRPRITLGDASMPQIAAMMGINPRTLRRRLATEGLTFEQVKDEVRFGAARELLEVTDLAIGDVASALSFATHSAFVHAFRRWSGTTPTAFRAAASGTTPARIAESLASV